MLWFVWWYGLGSVLLVAVAAGLPILDIQQGVVHSVRALVFPLFALVGVNVAWLWSWFAMHARGWVQRSYGFFPGWFAVQMLAWVLWPHLFGTPMKPYIKRMYTFAAVTGAAVLLYGFTVSSILLPLFNSSSELGRILVRLVALTAVTEFFGVIYRVGTHNLLSSKVPGVVRGTLVLPLSMFEAIVGRILVTGMNSFALTIALSILAAAVEGILRRTSVQRFEWYLSVQAWVLHRWCSTCSKGGRIAAEGRSDKQCHATIQRSHATFLLGETMASDVGMLTLIPVAIFFRLPTRIGGQPLPLGDVLLRVGFQLLLELSTDVAPFALYAVGRAWLRWRGDKLYRAVNAQAIGSALARLYGAETTTAHAADIEQATAQKSVGKDQADMSSAGSSVLPLAVSDLSTKYACGAALLVDDSAPIGESSQVVEDPAGLTAGTWSLQSGTSTLNASVSTPVGQSSSSAHDAPTEPIATPSMLGESRSRPQCSSCRTGDHLYFASNLEQASAETERRLASLRADDADVLWQRLPWTAVRAAMSPGAGSGEWGWLHWFVYRNELLATRMSAAWRRRQPAFLAVTLWCAFALHGFVMRTNLGTSAACPRLDDEGQRFFDACGS